jgi:Protein of unknown function (DUF2955)
VQRAIDPRPQRALRLATGVAAATAVSYGLALPVPFIAPVLTLFLLASRSQPLPLNAIVGLPVLVTLTTSAGLLLIPVLQYAPVSGVLLVGLAMFLCFRHLLRGGSPLPAMFLVVGLTLISAAGTSSFYVAKMVIEALATGLVLAGVTVGLSHALFPDPPGIPTVAAPPVANDIDVAWIALRATLVVLPSFLLALVDPAAYMPLIMKSVALGQQACVTSARDAAREVLGATLLGGLFAVAFWNALSIFPHLWMFFLWTLLFSLLLARKLYALSRTRLPPGLWLNTLTTTFILLGQSVQDAAAGKDVYAAFASRMVLFIAVTIYACAMIYLIDNRRASRTAAQLRGSSGAE